MALSKRRRWVLVAAGVGLLVVVATRPGPEPEPAHRFTLEEYHRIQLGMTRAEVEAILGPPRNLVDGQEAPWARSEESQRYHSEWTDSPEGIEVYYASDRSGRVISKYHLKHTVRLNSGDHRRVWVRDHRSF